MTKIEAGELTVGDRILLNDGRAATVERIEPIGYGLVEAHVLTDDGDRVRKDDDEFERAAS